MAARTVYRVNEGMASCEKRKLVLGSNIRVLDKMGLYVLFRLRRHPLVSREDGREPTPTSSNPSVCKGSCEMEP